MQYGVCEQDFTASKLSPGVIDGQLKLVCWECWRASVKSNRATLTTEEQTHEVSLGEDQDCFSDEGAVK